MMYQLNFYEARFAFKCYFPQRKINVFDINTAAIIKFVNSRCEIIFYDPYPEGNAKSQILLHETVRPGDRFIFLESVEPVILFMDVALQNIQYIPLYDFPSKFSFLDHNKIEEAPFDEALFMKYVEEKLEYLHKYPQDDQRKFDYIKRFHVFYPNYIRNHPEKLDLLSFIHNEKFGAYECDALCDVILNKQFPYEYRMNLYNMMIENVKPEILKDGYLPWKLEKIEKEVIEK